jgi:hypothetical protein
LLHVYTLAVHIKPKTTPDSSKREDRVNFHPQHDLRLMVCKNQVESIGQGVTVIVFVHKDKVLKFDLFEQNAAHFHILTGNPQVKSGAIAMAESTLDSLAARLRFELQYNLHNYLALHSSEAVRELSIDSKALLATLDELETAIKARGDF